MSHPTTARALTDAIRALAEPVAERFACEIVAIELLGGAGGRRVLRISVDRPGGATIDDCTRISRAVSPALDAADIIAQAYDLEVSTPGIERPLQREKDWVYFQGCTVRLKTWDMDSRRRVKGVIEQVAEGVLSLRTEEGVRTYPLDSIERANLVLDLDQYARMGEGLHPIADPTNPGDGR